MAGSGGTVEWAVRVRDETSGPAMSAAQSLKKLKEQIDGDTKAIREMEAMQRMMSKSGALDAKVHNELKDKIKATKLERSLDVAALLKGQPVVAASAKAQAEAAKGAQDAAGKHSKLTEATRLVGNAMGHMREGVGSAVQGIGSLVSSIASAVMGAKKYIAAIGAAGAALIAFGIHAADDRRTQEIQMQGLASLAKAYRNLGPAMMFGGGMWAMIAGKAGAATRKEGADLLNMIGRVTDEFAVSGEQVTGYTKRLIKARVGGKDLELALRAASTLGSTLGEEAASSFINMSVQARFFGKNVGNLANNVIGKFGDMARGLKLGLGEQMKQLWVDVKRLFGGVNVEPFLQALHSVLRLFSQNTFAGKAMKSMMNGLFAPLNALVGGSAGKGAESMFKGMLIWVMKLEIGVLKMALAVKKWMSGASESVAWQYSMAIISGEVDVVVASVKMLWAFLKMCGKALSAMGAGDALTWLLGMITQLVERVKGFSDELTAGFEEAGGNIIEGLVKGIGAATHYVFDYIKILGKGIGNAFANAIGAKSPSLMFSKFGGHIGAGLQGGIRASAGGVMRASAGLGAATHIGAMGGLRASAGVGGGASIGGGVGGGFGLSRSLGIGGGGSIGGGFNIAKSLGIGGSAGLGGLMSGGNPLFKASASLMSLPNMLPGMGAGSARAPMGAQGSRGGGGNTINITIEGAGKDAKSVAREVMRELEDILEGEVLISGAPLLEPA